MSKPIDMYRVFTVAHHGLIERYEYETGREFAAAWVKFTGDVNAGRIRKCQYYLANGAQYTYWGRPGERFVGDAKDVQKIS